MTCMPELLKSKAIQTQARHGWPHTQQLPRASLRALHVRARVYSFDFYAFILVKGL